MYYHPDLDGSISITMISDSASKKIIENIYKVLHGNVNHALERKRRALMRDLNECSDWLIGTIAVALKTPPSKIEMCDLSYAIGMKWPRLTSIALQVDTDSIIIDSPFDTKSILIRYNAKLRECAYRVYRQRRHIY